VRWLFASLLCTAAASAAAQQVDALDARDAMRASQAAVGSPVGAHTLLDREGRPVPLSSYRGRPLLVSFVYTGCFQVCPTSTRSLDHAVAALQSRFGTGSFAVASIGFNQPADSPQAMKAFAAQQRISRPGWDFLSAPAAVVPALARNFGFRFAATPAGFDHVLQVSVVDAEGRIVRQVYGDKSATQELVEALGRLAAGAPQPSPGALDALIEQVRILCTVYDPKTGTYRVDYSLALEVAGGITFILFIVLYMANEWWTARRERRHGRRARA
jgi:protein SCO1